MGARASIKVTCGNEESPVLCQHWGGSEFHEVVRDFVKGIYEDRPKLSDYKLDPKIKKVLADKYKCGEGDLELMTRTDEVGRIFTLIVMNYGSGGYIGKTESEVDDSDYGCLTIELGEGKPIFHLGGYSHE